LIPLSQELRPRVDGASESETDPLKTLLIGAKLGVDQDAGSQSCL
jgi:hypothetical protein